MLPPVTGGIVARNSVTHLLATVGSLAAGLVAGVATARGLGPADKGLYATLVLLISIIAMMAAAGVGDALTVLGRGESRRVRAAIPTTLTLAMATMVTGALSLTVVLVGFRGALRGISSATILTSLLSYVFLLASGFGINVLIAVGRIRASSVAYLAVSAAGAVAAVVLVLLLHLGLVGALSSAVVASAVGVVVACVALRGSGLPLRLGWDGGYARRALSFGLTLQAGLVLTSMTSRVDLLLVYGFLGSADAGQYSVALTCGTMLQAAPTAVAYALFARIITLPREAAWDLTSQAFRLCAVSGALLLGAAVAALPLVLPPVFGAAYRPAVVPSLLTCGAGVLYGLQFLLARALAAAGTPRPMLESFAAGLLVMLVLDVFLIPRAGLVGAGLGAVAGPAAGLLVVLWSVRRLGAPVHVLLPRRTDVAALGQILKAQLARPANKRRGTPAVE